MIGSYNFGDTFTGFLYHLKASQGLLSSDLSGVLALNCTANQFINGNSCVSCSSSCNTFPLCVSESCSICQSCEHCSGYAHNKKLISGLGIQLMVECIAEFEDK